MMKAHLFRERTRLPAFHPGSGDGNPVNRTGLDRAVTPHLLEAFPAKHLTSARNMHGIGKLMGVTMLVEPVVVFDKRRASDTELRITSEFLQYEFEVVVPESNVGIEIGYE